MIISKPPYQTGNPLHFKPQLITDNDYVRVQIWLQSYWSNPKKASVIDAVNVACQEQIISPVKHYLEGLAPSNIDIAEIFEKYFGVIPDNEEDQEFIRAASSLFFSRLWLERSMQVVRQTPWLCLRENKESVKAPVCVLCLERTGLKIVCHQWALRMPLII